MNWFCILPSVGANLGAEAASCKIIVIVFALLDMDTFWREMKRLCSLVDVSMPIIFAIATVVSLKAAFSSHRVPL